MEDYPEVQFTLNFASEGLKLTPENFPNHSMKLRVYDNKPLQKVVDAHNRQFTIRSLLEQRTHPDSRFYGMPKEILDRIESFL